MGNIGEDLQDGHEPASDDNDQEIDAVFPIVQAPSGTELEELSTASDSSMLRPSGENISAPLTKDSCTEIIDVFNSEGPLLSPEHLGSGTHSGYAAVSSAHRIAEYTHGLYGRLSPLAADYSHPKPVRRARTGGHTYCPTRRPSMDVSAVFSTQRYVFVKDN